MKDYIAGFFDAEGCVLVTRRASKSTGRPTFMFSLSITNTNKEVMEKVSEYYPKDITSEDRGTNRQIIYRLDYGKSFITSSKMLEDLLERCNEKYHQLYYLKKILYSTLIGEREEYYIKFKEAKSTFNHDLVNKPSVEYIAGLMDGDGYISMFRTAKPGEVNRINYISVGIEQRYKPIVDYIGLVIGSLNTINHKINSPSHKPTFSVSTRDYSKIEEFISSIYPYLIQDKKRAELLLGYIKELKSFLVINSDYLERWKDRGELKYGVQIKKQSAKGDRQP